MNGALIQLIDIFQPNGVDWMNYRLTKSNPYNFHHIIKKEHGGKAKVENGAILTATAHQYLHLIEHYEYQLYLELNSMLEVINQQQYPPYIRQRLYIEQVLSYFENKHQGECNKKGNLIIKQKFLIRDRF